MPTGSYKAAPSEWRGTIFDFSIQDGRRLWLVTVHTTQLSNDHYAYRELLLEPTGSDPNTWALVDARGWQFDIAGIEGLEWQAMAVVIGVLAGIPVLTLLGLHTAFGVVIMHRRDRVVGFEPIMR